MLFSFLKLFNHNNYSKAVGINSILGILVDTEIRETLVFDDNGRRDKTSIDVLSCRLLSNYKSQKELEHLNHTSFVPYEKDVE